MKTTLLLLSIFISFNACTTESKCTDFKTGTFEYLHPNFSEWTVIRTATTQTETSSKSGVEIQSSIEWISDCEYVLTYKKMKNTNFTDLIGSEIHVNILETNRNKYKCHTINNGIELDLEMIKIE